MMLAKLKKLLMSENQSTRIDQAIVEKYISHPENPFLVSFPRTGSHWLRMLMELYYKRPTLVRAFYYPDNSDYLLVHTHDMQLSVERSNVIYLYRDPVPTVYSQMSFDNEDTHDQTRIAYWGDVYGKHLYKWLVTETFTTQKTVVTYEKMVSDMDSVFQAITAHLGGEYDAVKLKEVMAIVTKEEVKRKTEAHDERVVRLADGYQQTGKEFKEKYSDLVWQSVLKDRPELKQFFANL